MRRPAVISFHLVVLVLLLAGGAWADLNSWTATGPAGGPIRAVLVDPSTPATIYVGTVGSGVFKSTNAGVTWTQTQPGGPLATRTVRALVRDTDGKLYAGVEDPVNAPSGSGVFQSIDGGTNWTAMDTGLTNKKVQALALDGTILYAGTREETVTVGTTTTTFTGGVFKWNGSTWTNISSGTNGLPTQSSRRVQALALDPLQAVIYAGTQGDGVYKTIDGGTTWTQLPNRGFRSDCLGSFTNGVVGNVEILSLVVDLTNPTETLYAGATGPVGTTGCTPTPSQGGHRGQGAGLFQFTSTANNPPSWDRRMAGDFETLLPTTLSANVWTIVMNGSAIYVGTDVGVLRSTNGAGSWNLVPGSASSPSGLISLPVRALGVDTSGLVTLYAGTSGRGVFKRSFTGTGVGTQPWIAANAGLTALRAQALAVGNRGGAKTLVAGLISGGIITSTIGANGSGLSTWQNTPETSRSVQGIAVDPTSPATVYAATAQGVLKSQDGGDTWTSSSSGLPTTTTQDPNNPTPPRTVSAILVDPEDPSVLYAAVSGVFRSVDGGASWAAVNGTAPNSLPSTVTAGNGTVSAFAVDHGLGSDPIFGTIYAGSVDGSGVFKSSNGGVSWAPVNLGIPTQDRFVTALAFDPLNSTLYAGTLTGKVYKTQNGGQTWTPVGPFSLPGGRINALLVRLVDLSVNPNVQNEVYAGVQGGGVFSLSGDGASWTAMNTNLDLPSLLPLSLDVAALALDTEGTGALFAATVGRGMFDFEFDPGANPPVVFNVSPPPPYPFLATTSPLVVTGSAADDRSVVQVFYSTNRGHAGLASTTSTLDPHTVNWTASVPLETGPNVITVTAVDDELHEGSFAFTVTLPGDTTPPTVTITTPTSNPTYTTTIATPLTIGGTAADNTSVTQVTWVNSLGGSGTASGTTSWTASVALTPGSNVITVTAHDTLGNTGTDVLTVTLGTPPTATITTPTSNPTFTATATPLTIGGSAASDAGLAQVTWVNSLGGSGTASGTTTWTASVALTPGSNVITVTAHDNLGNTGTDVLTVTLGLFTDVTPDNVFFSFIQALATAGITGGCATSPPQYCPDSGVTRDQMAVFLLRGIHGAGYQPPAATGTMFTDVPLTQPFANWIEQLASEGITGGCSIVPRQYCPDSAVTRDQMAVFLLRAKHGAGYQPPAATGTMFTDVPLTLPFAKWIEQLAREGITGGCGPTTYCPDNTVTRDQMAVFLVRAFNLPM